MASFLRAPVAPSKWATLIAVSVGLAMLTIDTFVVNVAFPAIGRDLDASLSAAEWTVTSYVLVVGVLPLAMGRLGDIFGRRRVYLFGLLLFVAASAACGAAANIEQLVLFRVIQGIGAATMTPGTLSIVTHAFPPEQRGLAIGTWGGVSGVGLIAGPILGGLLVRGDEWRWIFLVNVPVGVAAILMALRFVPESRDESAPRSVDYPGALLLSAGLGLIMLGITRGNEEGWSSPLILGGFAAGLLVLAAFVFVELRRAHPLVNLRLFRQGTFVMACVSAMLFSAAVFGSQPFASLLMQNYMGFSALEAGLAFVPATALVAVLMPFSGIMGQKLGPQLRLIVAGGSACVAVSFLYMLRIDTGVDYTHDLLPALVVRGLGIGLFMSATSLAVMSAVPVQLSGLASGTLTMFRQVGVALGVAIFGAIFLHDIESDLPVRLDGASETQAAQVTAAASHFVPAGEGEVREAAREEIVDGYVLISLAAVAISLVAMGSAFLIRHRPAGAHAPAVAPAEPAAALQAAD